MSFIEILQGERSFVKEDKVQFLEKLFKQKKKVAEEKLAFGEYTSLTEHRILVIINKKLSNYKKKLFSFKNLELKSNYEVVRVLLTE